MTHTTNTALYQRPEAIKSTRRPRASSLLVSWAAAHAATDAELHESLAMACGGDPLASLEADAFGVMTAWGLGAEKDRSLRSAAAYLYAAGVLEPPRVGRPRRW